MSDPATPTPRTTGGNARWEPPSPAELQEQMPGYTIEKLLGRGGMGAVYKGVQSNLDRPVAIKILPPGVEQEDPSFAERFKNEARLMARLINPAVVSVHDFGLTTGGLLYFAMEYVNGTDVSQMIRSQGKLPPEHALAITAHVCDALSAAHELGIVHRDIKPANVLINRKGQVKVADFGLAKIEEPGTHGLTKTGYAMGTPDFVAPEVLMLGSHIDGRADLYAVGVMLYQMLTGEVPRGAFKPATARLPGLDPRFDPIILKAMQSDREERYQSSTELRRDLDVILTVPLVPTSAIPAAQVAQTPAQRSAVQKRSADAPVRSTPKAGEGTRAHLPPKKSSAPLLLGLGAVVALGIGAFVMMSGSEKEKQSGPLSPLSGTSGSSTSETSKSKPIATGQTITPADASSQASPLPTTKPGNPPPATPPAQTVSSPMAVSNWQRVESTEARWKKSGLEVKDGWLSFLTSPGESQKALVISSDIIGPPPRDVAVRIRFRKEKAGNVSLHCRYDTAKPMPEAILWDDGRFQLRNQNTPLGPVVDVKEVKLAKPAVGEEGILELAVIGQRVIARLNSSTVLEREVPGMIPRGPFGVRAGGQWIKDVEYLNLDGVADPLKELGWNLPATSPGSTAPVAVTPAPAAPPKPSVPSPAAATTTPASPSPSLPVSSSPPPVTTMAAATPASALDQRLAALDSSFQSAVERDANTAFKASMAALDKLYLSALDRALAAASQGGKLEEALALREEKQRIEKNEGVPSEVDESTLAPGKVPDTLKTLRKTYRSTTAQHEATKAKAMQPLYDKYDQALAAVQTELTQAQKLDDAMRVKTVREQIAATRGGGLPTPSVPGLAATPPDSAPKASSSGQPALDPFDPLLDYSRLPRWHQDAMKEGGKLRVWGYWDGQKIEERSLLRPFSESDYTRVVADTGDPGVLLGVRKRGAGKRILLENRATPAAEYKKVQAIESHSKWWLADNFLHRHQRRGSELELDEGALLSGIGDAHFIQRKNREWTAGGYQWTNKPNDNQIESALNPLLIALKKGETTLITATANDVFWITKDNKYREFFVNLRPGSVKEAATTTNPSEPMVKLIHGGAKYGWLALGKSGAVYARNPNAFAKPLDDLPPALTLKNSGGQIAIRKTDGNWHGIGPDAEMNEVISQAGPAIDLDISVYEGNKRKMVVWIESKSTLRPTNTPTSTTKPAAPTPTPTAAPVPAPATAAKSDFTNSLGMKFVKVPGAQVLFCIHETRKGDYAKYAAETPGVDDKWKDQTTKEGLKVSEADNHPVVAVDWNDARAFCAWLSGKEGRIYRLPKDREWSYAAGIGKDENPGTAPKDLGQGIRNEYPWGSKYPPLTGVGNYADMTYRGMFPSSKVIEDYTDGCISTAPVMCFKPNKLGIYDLGGNVWEFCEDLFDQTQRVTRGASWKWYGADVLLSSFRGPSPPNNRANDLGFRIVLETTE
ncbi:MAG: SUMF1/EgtB/PvdO family nonheme iron enzyme [Prosthecobacter sp.]|uniref:bifunctional serine/threonine-protein kinase/formylglycine-generating enzyme family protein n=1 Tax=Prosthecobacter sp. TaxID=1965333 RepID=UPI0019E6D513|nr:SUMF1/EgtB/PvdO family nonheme iron enzyme [Prosthecobacter sp.]